MLKRMKRNDHKGARLVLTRRLKWLGRDEDGVAAIEFAFILPFLVMLLLGAMELFNMSQASRKLTLATTTMGDLVTQAGNRISMTDINGYYAATKPIMGALPPERLAISIFTYTLDNNNRPRLSWQVHKGSYRCSNAPTLTSQQRQAMQDGNDLVITRGCYKYRLTLGRIIFTDTEMEMRDEVTFRPRNSLTVECTNCSS